MKWKDSNDHARLEVKSDGDFMDEENESLWHNPSDSGFVAQISTLLKQYAPILTGVALFVVIVAGLKIIFFSGGAVDNAKIKKLEEKINRLDEKYGKFDTIDDKVTRIWEQAKSFENFKERFDRAEASMTLRMDHLATNVDSVQKRLAAAETNAKKTGSRQSAEKKSPPKSAPKSVSVQYHTVTPKETLYGISIKYGIKLDDLLEMNNMGKDSVIQPGQKLIVKR